MNIKQLTEEISSKHPSIKKSEVREIIYATFSAIANEVERASTGKLRTPAGDFVSIKRDQAVTGGGKSRRINFYPKTNRTSPAPAPAPDQGEDENS
ncbi:hypothetical protein [Ideonella livida]|uniref:Uncharacterized protein n=1 Tax=Ideonella livida TaxID=2707176 RepID=A0A7C9PIF6_9BURK|nr:hypothetical protein [Ideonella livida]NDY91934.1 hypothetical protein [Ideonella livida]